MQLTALFRAFFPFREQLHFCSLWKSKRPGARHLINQAGGRLPLWQVPGGDAAPSPPPCPGKPPSLALPWAAWAGPFLAGSEQWRPKPPAPPSSPSPPPAPLPAPTALSLSSRPPPASQSSAEARGGGWGWEDLPPGRTAAEAWAPWGPSTCGLVPSVRTSGQQGRGRRLPGRAVAVNGDSFRPGCGRGSGIRGGDSYTTCDIRKNLRTARFKTVNFMLHELYLNFF